MGDDEFVERGGPKKAAGGRKPAKDKAPTILKKDKFDALYVVLDCGASMAAEENGTSSFSLAKEAVDWILSRKIFTLSKDRVNIVLFGAESTQNSLNAANVFLHEEALLPVKFDHIRFLLNEVQMTQHSSNVVDGLMVAVDALREQTECNPYVESKTVLLLTNGAGSNKRSDELTHIGNALNAVGANLVVMGLDESKADSSNSVQMLLNLVESVEGTTYNFSEACSALQHFTQKTTAPRANRKNWEVAPGVRLPLSLYTTTTAAVNPLKSVMVNEDGEKVERHRQLLVKTTDTTSSSATPGATLGEFDEPDDVKMDEGLKIATETVFGYRFGSSKVVINQDDEERYNKHNFNEGEPGGCLKLIQFTKSENILRGYLVGKSSYMVMPGWDKKTSDRDTHLMRTTLSLIEGMLREDVVAICRYGYHVSAHLQLMALFPRRDEASGHLYLMATRLPFMDDWRPFTFPDLHAREPAPNSAQLDLVDELIDAMDLTNSNVSYEKVMNPAFQRQCTMMKLKALNNIGPALDSKMAEQIAPSVFLKRSLEPDPSILAKAKNVFDVFLDDSGKAGFALEKIVKAKRVREDVVPQLKDHLKGIFEEDNEDEEVVVKKEPAGLSAVTSSVAMQEKLTRAAKKAIEGGSAAMEQLLSSIAFQMSMFDGTTPTAVDQFLLSRAEFAMANGSMVFNRWLMSLQGNPDYADFCQYMDDATLPSLISFDECSNSSYSAVDGQMYWSGIVVEKDRKVKDEEMSC